MNDLPRQQLREIIGQYGRSLCDDPRRTEALLRDFCGEHKREIFILVSALKERVTDDLLSSQESVPQEILLGRLTKRLQDNLALTEDAAQWAVESWALALGMISPKELSTSEEVVQSPSSISTSIGKSINDSPLKPYTLSIGCVATTLNELLTVCDADWNRAAEHFARGYMVDWLRDNITDLRAIHQHGMADELEELTTRTEEVLRRIRDRGGFNPNVGLEQFLRLLGAAPPMIEITPGELAFSAVGVGETGQPLELVISNRKRGYLYGTVESKVPWLEVTPGHFGCAMSDRCLVTVRPDLSDLSPGRIRSVGGFQSEASRQLGQSKKLFVTLYVPPNTSPPEGTIGKVVLRSNGGNEEIVVVAEPKGPRMLVTPEEIDLGCFEQEPPPTRRLHIENAGNEILEGRVKLEESWLQVEESKFQIPPKNSKALTLRPISEHPVKLRLPAVNARPLSTIIQVTSNGGNISVPVKLISKYHG